MKKLILLFMILVVSASISHAEKPLVFTETTKEPINLHLRNNYVDDTGAWVCLVSGLAIMTATYFEGSKNYTSSFQPINGHLTSVSTPFLQQTPRQIFFIGGGVVTISSIIMLLSNK